MAQPAGALTVDGDGANEAPRCGRSPLHGTKAQMKATPRPNRRAEELALRTTDALVAPMGRYQRIVADLAAIRTADGRSGTHRVKPSFGTSTLIIELPPAQMKLAQKGTYQGLDCLNEWYGGRIHNALTAMGMIFVRFPGVYHPIRLLESYREHPDPLLIEADTIAGSGDDIRLCNAEFGGVHRYIFQKGSGDCLSGCIEMVYWGYDVTPKGKVTRLASWVGRSHKRAAEPAPSWVQPGCFPARAKRYYISPRRPTP